MGGVKVQGKNPLIYRGDIFETFPYQPLHSTTVSAPSLYFFPFRTQTARQESVQYFQYFISDQSVFLLETLNLSDASCKVNANKWKIIFEKILQWTVTGSSSKVNVEIQYDRKICIKSLQWSHLEFPVWKVVCTDIEFLTWKLECLDKTRENLRSCYQVAQTSVKTFKISN